MSTRVRDCYQVLGVPRTASQEEVRSAFRRLARKHHPDVNPNDAEATQLYAEVNVRLPLPLTPELRELAERLRQVRTGRGR